MSREEVGEDQRRHWKWVWRKLKNFGEGIEECCRKFEKKLKNVAGEGLRRLMNLIGECVGESC